MTKRTVHSAVAVVPLADLRDGAACSLPLSTRAGRLALRRALVAVARMLDPASELQEDGFAIEHDPSGAPKVVAVPPGFAGGLEALRVSISHTRSRAWALAAIEVPGAKERT